MFYIKLVGLVLFVLALNVGVSALLVRQFTIMTPYGSMLEPYGFVARINLYMLVMIIPFIWRELKKTPKTKSINDLNKPTNNQIISMEKVEKSMSSEKLKANNKLTLRDNMRSVINDLWGTNETRAALIVSLALVLSVIIYCLGTSYQMVRFEKFGYMYNRLTGASWYYMVDEYVPTKEGK